uniref:Uncharacterized mitochondrial protein AtMg00810-like n=1 Tax=Nicotiana tabacum TaxID=4097 RepID=A0A1S3XK55_TOBAC|nr:PREDICTED: uncharacterized mitochondrial protein AtMg00810-like [Nicotiana tabacum]
MYFLHGNLDEEVYMRIPQGMVVSGTNMICKLKKSLYGLKQASRQWYSKLSESLISLDYSVSKNDYSLFIKSIDGCITVVAVYVDDIFLSGNDDKEIKFTLDLLSELNCLDYTPVASPLDVAVKFKDVSGEPLSDPTLYKQLVGKLNFLTNTRPYLAFAVQFHSQFMHAPSSIHLTAAYHVLRYVNGTLCQGLLMSNASEFFLQAYCDSDWATCPTSRRSVSSYLVLLGGSLLTWKSKKQHTVALSSIEVEYRSMHRVVAELAWLTRLLSELSMTFIIRAPLHLDSQSAIYTARNHAFHERTKHIELDCHFVHEKLHEGLISLSFVPSSLQTCSPSLSLVYIIVLF